MLRWVILGLVCSLARAEEASRFRFSLDMRPTRDVVSWNNRLENQLSLSYRLSESLRLGYTQDIWDDELHDGFATFSASGDKLSYQGRLYLPTWKAQRAKGQVVILRNYLILTQALTPEITVVIAEVPILPIFDRQEGNYYFWNRFLVQPQLTLGNFSANVALYWDLRRTYKHQWTNALTIQPEAMWKLDEAVTVGLSYQRSTGGEAAAQGILKLTF